MTRKREHRMTVRLNGDEYTKVLSKIERSGLSKQEYILSSILNKKIQERLNVDYFKLINEVNCRLPNYLNMKVNNLITLSEKVIARV